MFRCVFASLLLWLSASAGAAEPARAELRYARGTGSEACPTEAAFAGAVSVRLGYSPFVQGAEGAQRIDVSVERVGPKLRALIKLRSAAGEVLGEREMTSEGLDCRELSDSLALAVSMALDPLSVSRPRAVVAPEPEPEPWQKPQPSPEPGAIEASEVGPPPEPPRESVPIGVSGALGVAGGVGNSVQANVGLELGVELRRRNLAFWIGVRADAPAGATVYLNPTPAPASGIIYTFITAGELAPCYRLGWFGGCALGLFGAQTAWSTGLSESGLGAQPYIGLGARVLLEIPVTARFAVRGTIDALASLLRADVDIHDRPIFVPSLVAGNASLSAVWRFR